MTTWIFQGNPDDFDVNQYLTTQTILHWEIRQKHFREKFARGDVVYIWRSKGKRGKVGGIVAKGRTTSLPQTEDIGYHDFWFNPPEPPIELWIEIEVDGEPRLTEAEGMLTRDELMDDEILADMKILRFRNETNYELTERQAQEIDRLWEGQG